MTEDEARKRWCPMVRFNETGANRWTYKDEAMDTPRRENPEFARCIASDCMMWQATDNEIKENPEGPIENGRAMKASDYASAGYCGLAK